MTPSLRRKSCVCSITFSILRLSEVIRVPVGPNNLKREALISQLELSRPFKRGARFTLELSFFINCLYNLGGLPQ